MSQLWIVRDSLGQIQGPFETSDILLQIKNNVYTGDEQIASYPEGAWQNISSHPDFFDYMLSVLAGADSLDASELEDSANEEEDLEAMDPNASEAEEQENYLDHGEVSRPEIPDLLSDAEAVFPAFSEKDKQGKKPVNKNELLSKPEGVPIQHREAKGRSHLFEDRQTFTIDRLNELKRKSEGAKRNRKFLYLLVVMAVGLFCSLFFVEDGNVEKSNFYTYVLPTPSNIKIENDQQKKSLLKKAVKLIQSDLVFNVMKSQTLLNTILSYEPRNKTSLLLLCGSYLRLWEYTGKTSRDLFVVSETAKKAYGIGGSGDVLYVCRLTEMILRGKIKEANVAVDSYLNSEVVSSGASFYLRYFKGLLLMFKKDFSFAISFLESSVKLEPRWIPSLMLLGQAYQSENRSQEAYNVFRRVLKLNPHHPEALFQLSILNIEVFSKYKVGLTYFNKALEAAAKSPANNSIMSRAYSVLAQYFLRQRRFKKASEFSSKAFDLDPSNISAKNIMISTGAETDVANADKYVLPEADALYNAQEWKAAIALYEQAYQMNPKNGFAALRIAKSYWRQSFITDAIKWAELAVAADPKRIESYITLGEFLTEQYRLDDAARVLMKARIINKTSFEIYRGFARIELYRKNYKGAVRYTNEALKLYSNDVASIIIKVKALKAIGEIEKAYANARAAMEVSRSSFELENLYAELAMRTQGLAFAKQYLEERLKASSGDFKYNVILANMYLIDQQYNKAAQISMKANNLLDWEMVEGVLVYARAMGALGKLELALDNYEKAYLMKPSDAGPLFESGVMLIENVKPKRAIRQFERVERANPLFPDLSYQWAVATKLLAEKEKSVEYAQKAIDLCRQEIARDPSHFESYILIAESYYVLGNIAKTKTEKTSSQSAEYSEIYSEMVSWYKLCAKSYQKAIEKAVQPGNVYIDMARCYRLSGALDQARASAVVAESLDKTNPRIWFETAQIYEQQGDYRAALKAYENFLIIYPNAPNKKEVENQINKLKSISEEK